MGQGEAGSDAEGERHELWPPGPLSYSFSSHFLSPILEIGVFVCGIICDPSSIHNLGLCPTEAWELPKASLIPEGTGQVLVGWPWSSWQRQGGPGNSQSWG